MSNGNRNEHAYVEMSMLADRIVKMMDECASTYAPAKKHISEARKLILIQPKKAVREMRRGFYLVEDEYVLVGSFQRCEASFSVNEKMSSYSDVNKLSDEFRSLIKDGKFKKAERKLREFRRLMELRGARNHLSLSAVNDCVEDGMVILKLTNVSDKDVTVDRISLECGDAAIDKTPPMVRSIKRGTSAEFSVKFVGECGETNTVFVDVGYQVDMDEYSQRLSVKAYCEKETEE